MIPIQVVWELIPYTYLRKFTMNSSSMLHKSVKFMEKAHVRDCRISFNRTHWL